jgi:hypothetical protein
MQAEKIKNQSPHIARHGEMIRFPSGSVFHHFAAAAARIGTQTFGITMP